MGCCLGIGDVIRASCVGRPSLGVRASVQGRPVSGHQVTASGSRGYVSVKLKNMKNRERERVSAAPKGQ